MDGIGFLGNLKLALNPELNVIIGGRGVGKSALLEAIRYGLDLPEHCPTDYRKSLVSYALTSSGKVTIYLRQVVKPGVERCYRVERVLDKSPQVYELDPSGEHLVDLPPISLLIDQAKPLFFGQRDLYEVAQSPKLRRQFLDDLLGREADSKIKEINILKQELQDNARELIELYRKRNRQEQVEKRLIEIEHDLRPFERLGVAEKLREETALTRDEERLKRTETTYRDFQQEWQDVQKRWKEYLQRVLDDLGEAESRQKHLLQEDGTQAIRVLQERLEGIFQQVDEFLQQAQDSLHNVRQRWNDALQNLNEELRKIRQELGKDTLDPSDLLRLTQEKEKLDNELKQLNRVEAELKEKDQQRRDLLQKLRHKRKEAFHLREKMAREITTQIAQRVKVEVLHQGQRREYAEKLEEFFRGSGILKKELENIAYKEQIADGIDLVELVRKEKKEVMDKTGLSEAQAKKLKNFFEQDEKCQYELQLLSPEDEVQVSLNVNNRWIPLEKLSAGQRATAMLLILLTQTQHLIIIDQPEDDLDNHFVYEDVVKMLRDQKGKRQIIVATHNPNIPVLAHGELIVALEAESDCSRIHVQGSMDKREVQDEVRRVMEGGDEAFRRRAEKYGWG
jgi:recombinational DNA repair ATPase RecF